MRTLLIVAALFAVACGEGMPDATCHQVRITPTPGCFWVGDAYVKLPPADGGAPHGQFIPCTEALSCAD